MRPSPAALARLALVATFGGMGVAHFLPGPARSMAAMIPAGLHGRRLRADALVRFTGVCEIAGATGLLIPATRRAAGAALVVFLAAVFPANAEAARHPDRFGPVAIPFWPRLGGQAALGALVAWAAVS